MKKAKKIPIQVYLDAEQNKAIEALSRTTGKSKAAIIRHCISKFIEGLPPEEDPAMGIIGLGSSGKKDISQDHDKYLANPSSGPAK